MKFRILYSILLNKEIRSARPFYTRPWTYKVSCSFFSTMESLPLKELDFGFQKPTGPSSGVVASIVLIIITLSSVSFSFFYTTHTPFRLYWGYLYFEPLLKKSELLKNIKNPNLVIKLIIDRSCVTLYSEWITFLFSILCQVI